MSVDTVGVKYILVTRNSYLVSAGKPVIGEDKKEAEVVLELRS